jgi:Flp pilus assembly protein TadG
MRDTVESVKVIHSMWFAAIKRFLRRHEHGSALVETALALPILLIMLTGIFTFSIALNQKLLLSEAVSTGGRTLALERGATDPCADTANSIIGASPTLAKGSIYLTITVGGTNTAGVITGGTSYSSGGSSPSYTAPTCTAAGSGGASPIQAGWPAQITASYPCALAIAYGPKLGSCTVNAGIAETIQ